MPTNHRTLGLSLFFSSYNRTIWVDPIDITRHKTGFLNPDAPFSGVDQVKFETRYGPGSWNRKGDLVGERYSADTLRWVVRHPSNPLGIANNTAFEPTLQDRYDAILTTRDGQRSAWDTLILVLYKQLFPEAFPSSPANPPTTTPKPVPVPVPVPQPPTTTPPIPTTPPTIPPIIPPTPAPTTPPTTLDIRTDELIRMALQALAGTVRGHLPAPSWVVGFVSSPFVALAVRRAVEVYRKVMTGRVT